MAIKSTWKYKDRKFGGKKFNAHYITTTKREAKIMAKSQFGDAGDLYRVVPVRGGYVVYRGLK